VKVEHTCEYSVVQTTMRMSGST